MENDRVRLRQGRLGRVGSPWPSRAHTPDTGHTDLPLPAPPECPGAGPEGPATTTVRLGPATGRKSAMFLRPLERISRYVRNAKLARFCFF